MNGSDGSIKCPAPLRLAVVAALVVLLAESGAWLWMNPAQVPGVAVAAPGIARRHQDWTYLPELYAAVKPSLRCNSGWLADLPDPEGAPMRVGVFEWRRSKRADVLEAFKHLPEQCMGSIGMELEAIHGPRVLGDGRQRLVFDATSFRPKGGGSVVHVFKAVWVAGYEAPDLRRGVLGNQTGNDLRGLRMMAAAHRFKPPHSAVIMGAVAGMPTEELAWRRFLTEVLADLEWKVPPVR